MANHLIGFRRLKKQQDAVFLASTLMTLTTLPASFERTTPLLAAKADSSRLFTIL